MEDGFASERTGLCNEDSSSGNGNSSTLMTGMTFLQAFAIFVSSMLGTGIFITPSLVAARTPNMFIAIIVWLLAGGIALLGSLCYCEIVSVVNKIGSEYIFVYQCYGKLAGYVIIWMYIIIMIPFWLGVRIYTLGIYACAPFFDDRSSVIYSWTSKCVGLLGFYAAVIIAIVGVSFSAKVTYFFNIVQIMFLLFFTGIGVYYATVTGDVSNLSPATMFNNTWAGLQEHPRDLGAAIFSALYTVDGWANLANFVEEINDPGRNLPLLAFTAIPLITFINVAVTVISLLVLTQKEMASSIVVLTSVVEKGAGKYLGYTVPLFAVTCGFAGMLSFMYVQPRFVLSAAREGQLPSIFRLIEKQRKTPVTVIIYIAIVGTVSALFGEYVEFFIQYLNVGLWIQYGLAISCVIYLRQKLPNVRRTYRVWITTPLVTVLVSILLVVWSLWRSPLDIAVILLVALSGIPVYYVYLYKDWCSSVAATHFVDKLGDKMGWVKCDVNVLKDVDVVTLNLERTPLLSDNADLFVTHPTNSGKT